MAEKYNNKLIYFIELYEKLHNESLKQLKKRIKSLNNELILDKYQFNSAYLKRYIFSVSRFNPRNKHYYKVLEVIKKHSVISPREIVSYIEKSPNVDEAIEGYEYSTLEISSMANNFNNLKGMYVATDSYNTETVIIKATLNDKGNYKNKWIIKNERILYYFENENKLTNHLNRNYSKRPNQLLYFSYIINNPIEVHLFYRPKKIQPYRYDGIYKLVKVSKDGIYGEFVKNNAITDDNVLEYNETTNYENKHIKTISFSDDIYRELMTKTRLKQGVFRDTLIREYSENCMMCSAKGKILLIASHIKPYYKCSVTEASDSDNGLLLCPDHDKLFDLGYITINQNGKIILSTKIDNSNKLLQGINKTVPLTKGRKKYLKYHYENVFIK